MASPFSHSTTLLLLFVLCALLHSQAGAGAGSNGESWMVSDTDNAAPATIPTPIPAPAPTPPSVTPTPVPIPAPAPLNCTSACDTRCHEANLHKRCIKYCNICCRDCHCVPSGHHGNEDECPCYRDKKNSRGGDKCP